jgi:hypothetical protein
MNDPCARSVTWGDTTYPLTLNNPWVRNVLNFCGINGKQAAACLAGFEIGAYSIDDVERILELGLIGAGMADRDADKLLDQHVRSKPIGENARAAADALAALYVGAAQ